MQRPTSAAARISRECLLIVAVCLGLAALLWYATLERIVYERGDAISAATRSNDNLTMALEEQTIRALKAAEQILLFMKHEIVANRRVITLEWLAEHGMVESDIFAAAFVVDAAGLLELPDGRRGATLQDRAYFDFHRVSSSEVVRIGEPVVGRVTGEYVIPVTLRRTARDGSFAGVYVVGIKATYFVSSFNRFEIGREGVIQLVGLDAISRARRAGDRLTFGEDRNGSSLMNAVMRARNGNLVTAGLEGREPRFQSYRTLRNYPLVVAVGTSVRETLADFHERARIYYWASAAVTAVLAALCLALVIATQRRAGAMEELRASENLYRVTFEKGGVGIAHHALDGRFLKANARYCGMVGYTQEELQSRTFFDLLPEGERALARHGQAALLADPSGRPLQVETRHIRKDGTALWCAVTVAMVRDGEGRAQYAIAMIQDIGERKAAEIRLLEQLDELRRFQAVTVDRELRMMELEAELARLKQGAHA